MPRLEAVLIGLRHSDEVFAKFSGIAEPTASNLALMRYFADESEGMTVNRELDYFFG